MDMPQSDAEETKLTDMKPGNKYGHYVVEEKIGAGGMGMVFRARDTRLDRLVALKVLPPLLSTDKTARKRFRSEAKAISKMDHPNVCVIHDIGETPDNQLYFAMPCYEGKTLKKYMREGSLSIKRSIEILIQVCRGISAAHNHDVVHRDIKPANVLITEDGGVKVLDFGIAKLSGLDLTQTGQVIGTILYMSPEQLRTDPLDHRTDIWSLGVLFYQLMTRTLPFDGGSTLVVSQKITACEPAAMSSLVKNMGPVAETIIRKTLQVRPSERYHTVEELIRDLELLLKDADDSVQRVAPPASVDEEHTRTSPLMSTTLNSIAVELEKYVGSSAYMLVRTISQQTNTLDEMVLRLENELPDTSTRTAFRKEITAIRDRVIPKKRHTKKVLLGSVVAVGILAALVMINPRWRSAIRDRISALTPSTQVVRGVTHDKIVLGMTAAFSGSARELGRSMQVGVESRLREINDAGGIHNRELELRVMDDAYEPDLALDNLAKLLDPKDGVFALIGNVGTPTAKAMLPEILEDGTILFGTFSGAQLLRREPADKYVFNYRASYAEETEAIVEYFVKIKEISPDRIGVFYQDDSYGLDGLKGVEHALRQHGINEPIQTATHKRNTDQVQKAVDAFVENMDNVGAIVIISTYRTSATFTKALRDAEYKGEIANVSFVCGQALAEEFKAMGTHYGEGVIVSQVVPFYDSYAEGVIKYRAALKKYFPNESAHFVSLEGYIAATILCEGLKINGRELTTESLVNSLQSIEELDMGIGPTISFSKSNHQASHFVWGTRLNGEGKFERLSLTK